MATIFSSYNNIVCEISKTHCQNNSLRNKNAVKVMKTLINFLKKSFVEIDQNTNF